ncbi:MAG: efflux RND transporter permease subunit, partial [Gammaproteobacteria bacterium]|nr:efflux RND transporter permease subunit [Gammaproteobacteria bacterium]
MDARKGIIAWFARNSVAANLLMAVIIVSGLIQAFSIQKKTFPDFQTNNIQIQVPFLGAAPEDVEEGVITRVEEALQD